MMCNRRMEVRLFSAKFIAPSHEGRVWSRQPRWGVIIDPTTGKLYLLNFTFVLAHIVVGSLLIRIRACVFKVYSLHLKPVSPLWWCHLCRVLLILQTSRGPEWRNRSLLVDRKCHPPLLTASGASGICVCTWWLFGELVRFLTISFLHPYVKKGKSSAKYVKILE